MKRIINKIFFLLLFINIALLGCQCGGGPDLGSQPPKYLGIYHVENVHFWLENANQIKGITGTLIIEDSQAGLAKFTGENASSTSSFCQIMLSPETIQIFKNQYNIHKGSIKNSLYHLLLLDGSLYTPITIEILK